jgi:hypothetical protein
MDNPSDYDFWNDDMPEDDDLVEMFIDYLIGLLSGDW